MAKDDYTVKIEDGRIMFMTSYRDEFGEEIKVANIITKERLIEIRDNCNRALANNVSTEQQQQCNIGDVMPSLPIDHAILVKAEDYFEKLCISQKAKHYPIKGFIAGAKWMRNVVLGNEA